MCGLVVVAGQVLDKDKELFSQMMYSNVVRGEDSTGLASIDPFTGEVTVLKDTLPSYLMIQEDSWKDTLKKDSCLLLGHCRAATRGSVNIDNAHPFEFENIIGMHNGTLTPGFRHHLGVTEEYGTDSETFYKALNDHGLDYAIQRAHGAYAFIWYDKTTHSLNVFKNDKRDLAFVYSKDKKTLILVSDPMFFYTADKYTRYPRAMDLSENRRMYLVENDTHISIDLPEQRGGGLGKASVRKIHNAGTVWSGHTYTGQHKRKKENAAVVGGTNNVIPFRRNKEQGAPPRLIQGRMSAVPPTKALSHEPTPDPKAPYGRTIRGPVSEKDGHKIETWYHNHFKSQDVREVNSGYVNHVIDTACSDGLNRDRIEAKIINIKKKIEVLKNDINSGRISTVKVHKKLLGAMESLNFQEDVLEMYYEIFEKPPKDPNTILPKHEIVLPKHPMEHLSLPEWKRFVQAHPCTHCHYHDPNWIREDCTDLYGMNEYLCPECSTSAEVQHLLDQGFLKHA
jgi:predicted glutamine amidotransferase